MSEYKSIRQRLENSIIIKDDEEALKCLTELDVFFEQTTKESTIYAKDAQALISREEKYPFLTENILTDISIEGIMILENGIVIDVNPSLEKIMGIANDQIIGKNFLNYVHPDYYPQIENLLSNNTKSRFEILVKRSHDSVIPVEIETNIITIGNKTIHLAAVRDITDRKKNEEQIYKLTAAISQSPAAIVITDTKGTIEYINPHFTKITGYTFEEAIGENPRILKSGKMPDEIYKELWDTVTSGNIWKGELLNKRKDGSLFWEMATIAPIKNDKGKSINYVAIKEDITNRKDAENAFVLTKQKLEEANATKDKFFSIIAHDLKNPFNIILGFSDLLLQNHKEYDIETREGVIKTIYEISLKTFNLLENLLAWSRSKAGNITHNPKIFDIKLIAYDSIGLFNEAAEKKKIKIYLDSTDDYSIFADRDMFAAVMRNLINNAIKFTQKNGKVSIFINKVNSKFIEISVKDSGIGIRQEKLGILFNIDRDWSTPGTEDEAGTGLGLILCKEFVEKNGGTIHVESMVGIGTTFTFTVPLAE